jgi:mevalonate pyrophosphate decarboxylase
LEINILLKLAWNKRMEMVTKANKILFDREQYMSQNDVGHIMYYYNNDSAVLHKILLSDEMLNSYRNIRTSADMGFVNTINKIYGNAIVNIDADDHWVLSTGETFDPSINFEDELHDIKDDYREIVYGVA